MKKINNIALCATLMVSAFLWGGCSDDFLKEKTDYSKLTPEIYNDYTGANMRLQDIYLRLLPNANDGLTYRSPSGGSSDIQSQATEEFSSLSWYVNPDVVVTSSSNLNDWFHVNKSTSAGPWGEIRNCNDAIEGISGGTLTQTQKDELLGQVYFFRAWQYYLLVKTYGGVPIIDKVQAADVSQASNLAVPRSTTKECIEFICRELDKAADMLPPSWGSDFGRVTRGAALALKGRALLLYASPLFNRADNKDRWQAAYDANKEAIEALKEGGFGLAYLDNPGLNSAGWSRMFSDYNSEEAVFVTLYNKVHDDNAAHEIYRNNRREQRLRPSNTAGQTSNTGMSANALMVDLFPMADGKKPTEVGKYDYNPLVFFKDRDPRFYRTFAFPGVYWRFEGDPFAWTGTIPSNVISKGEDYALWNYAWYKDTERQNTDNISGYGADMLGQSYRGVYVRKRSNDFDMTPASTCLYRWPSTSSENRQGAFGEGAMPHMEIRYAEVLLNLAEAACGIDKMDEAVAILKDIRKRAGYDPAVAGEDYGLGNLADRGKTFGAILYERQIEFAYEGKRFDDMRRWLLWDGGTAFSQVDGAPASWTLGGYSGNTCTYLGVEPFNGKRRDNIELCATATADEAVGKDPIPADSRPAAIDLKKELAPQFDALVKFYNDNLKRKVRRGDEIGKVVTFLPKYYFIGLTSTAQTNNVTLEQTIGWNDVNKGNANGTFDPLAE
ncbi:RagB/SusD family nutrient uptake outer membrane protein [Bacteroidales bacterium OttesenSCG-928-L03]|nr:RagB/SusD family nutrient uptake outer membrane protein [Bacteroidales bacterium OttesenSCG-928-L03]